MDSPEDYQGPVSEINNRAGYDQSVAGLIVRDCVCYTCRGKLVKFHHPKPFTFSIKCHDPGCSGTKYISKHYAAVIQNRDIEAAENMDEAERYWKSLEDL